jgi:hypothetical protein
VYGWLGWVVSWSAGRIRSGQRGTAMSRDGREGVIDSLQKKMSVSTLEVFTPGVITSVLAYSQTAKLHAS